MNRQNKDLIRTPITDASQIKCGMLVVFRCGFNPDSGKHILTRGFIRSIHQGVATIPAGSGGTFRVPVSTDYIRYELSTQ